MRPPDAHWPDEGRNTTLLPVREHSPIAPPDEPPGVPGFRTWRGVYAFVFVVFVLVALLLTWFTRYFA